MADKDFDYGLPQPGVMGVDPELHNRNVWFGIVFKDGDLRVQRYRSWLEYKSMENLEAIEYTTMLFEACNVKAAVEEANRLWVAHG